MLFISFFELFHFKKMESIIAFVIFCTILILFAGLRNEVGADWFAYFNEYYNNNSVFELGYSKISSIFFELNLHYNLFLLFVNFISIIFIGYSIYKNSTLLIFPLLIFFSNFYLYYNFSGIRQALAISFTCLALDHAFKKHLLTFLLLVLIATLFHSTAIIFLIIYFVPRKRISFKYLGALFFLFLIIYFSQNRLINLVDAVNYKAVLYYTEIHEKSESIRSQFLIGGVLRILPVLIVFYFSKKLFISDKISYIFNIYLFGTVLFLFTYLLSPDIGVRLSSYFTILDMYLVGHIIYFVSFRNKLIIVGLYTFIIFYKLIWYSGIDSYNYNTIIN